MSTDTVVVLEKPPETSFSLRYLMLIVTAIATGLAVTRLSVFGYREGFLAAAGVFVAVHLLGEIKLIRTRADLDSRTRRFHVMLRYVLLLSILAFFLIAFVGLSLERQRYSWLRMFLVGSIFIGKLSPLEMVLQLAFLSYLLLGLPPAPKVRWRILVLPMILAGLSVVCSYVDIVFLVQIACEAVEVSLPGCQHGVISQYAVDSGSIYAGMEPDLTLRKDRFQQASLWGAGAFSLACAYFVVVLVRITKGTSNARRIVVSMLPGLLLAAVYPCWLYAAGIRNLCPPLAAVSTNRGYLAFVCGLVSLVLVAVLLAYRSRDETTVGQPPAELPESSLATLVAMALACLASMGVFELETWHAIRSISLQTLPYFLVSFNAMVMLATLIVLIPKIYRVALHIHGPRRVIGHIEPTRLRSIFVPLVALVAVSIPNILWLGYAFRMWTLNR